MYNPLANVDLSGKNAKYGITFVFTFVLMFILSPGTFFEIEINGEKKLNVERKTKMIVTAVHSLIAGIAMVVFYYFYLSSCSRPKLFGDI